jgi:hypothetical protein
MMAIRYDFGRGAAGVYNALQSIRTRKQREEELAAQRKFQDEQRQKRLADQLLYHRMTRPDKEPPGPMLDVDYGGGNIIQAPAEKALQLSKEGFAPGSAGQPGLIGPPAPGEAIGGPGVWSRTPTPPKMSPGSFKVNYGDGIRDVPDTEENRNRAFDNGLRPGKDGVWVIPPAEPDVVPAPILYVTTPGGATIPIMKGEGTAASYLSNRDYVLGDPIEGKQHFVYEEPEEEETAPLSPANLQAINKRITDTALGPAITRLDSKGQIYDERLGGAALSRPELGVLPKEFPRMFSSAANDSLTAPGGGRWTGDQTRDSVLSEAIVNQLTPGLVDRSSLYNKWVYDDRGTPTKKDDVFVNKGFTGGVKSPTKFFVEKLMPKIEEAQKDGTGQLLWSAIKEDAKLYGIDPKDIYPLAKQYGVLTAEELVVLKAMGGE